ncbi:hypothetical protein AAG570_000994 [Ranatra chinensis]|uniref:Uncharacterized protein n=1 Tax=Ranatra chinensis TaxID=642074 RepID=A0ABD0YAL2_9HEMI
MIMHSIAYDSALVRIQQGMKDDVNRKAQSSPPFLKWLYRVYPIRIKEDEYKSQTRTNKNISPHGRTTSREESFVPGEIKPSCKKLQEKPKNLIESLIYITRPRSSRHQILRSEGIPYYRAENSRGNSKENTENYSEDEDKEYVEVLIKDQTFDKPDKKVGVLIQDNTVDDWLPVNEASYKGNNLEVETLSPSEAWKHLSQQQFLNNKVGTRLAPQPPIAITNLVPTNYLISKTLYNRPMTD